jgi:hypothetical protein
MDNGPWFPKHSETEMRRVTAETLYDLELECQSRDWGADPALVLDEEWELFRFRDGKSFFSREHVDWRLLKKRRRLKWIENAGGTDLRL